MNTTRLISLNEAWDDFFAWLKEEQAAGRITIDKQIYEANAARHGRRKHVLGTARAFRFFEKYRPGRYALMESVAVYD